LVFRRIVDTDELYLQANVFSMEVTMTHLRRLNLQTFTGHQVVLHQAPVLHPEGVDIV